MEKNKKYNEIKYLENNIYNYVKRIFTIQGGYRMKDSLDSIRKARNKLKKLSMRSSYGPDTFTTINVNGSSIPERWCPEVTSKVRLKDLPDIISEKVININGGTP